MENFTEQYLKNKIHSEAIKFIHGYEYNLTLIPLAQIAQKYDETRLYHRGFYNAFNELSKDVREEVVEIYKKKCGYFPTLHNFLQDDVDVKTFLNENFGKDRVEKFENLLEQICLQDSDLIRGKKTSINKDYIKIEVNLNLIEYVFAVKRMNEGLDVEDDKKAEIEKLMQKQKTTIKELYRQIKSDILTNAILISYSEKLYNSKEYAYFINKLKDRFDWTQFTTEDLFLLAIKYVRCNTSAL